MKLFILTEIFRKVISDHFPPKGDISKIDDV